MPYYQWTAINANVQYVQISPLVQQTVKFTIDSELIVEIDSFIFSGGEFSALSTAKGNHYSSAFLSTKYILLVVV